MTEVTGLKTGKLHQVTDEVFLIFCCHVKTDVRKIIVNLQQ